MTDEEIISLYREGKHEQAFGEIVKSYKERLYWHVRTLVGSHEDTDDILQDIFIKIWSALPSFRGEAQLYTWLYRIATNETLNFIKRSRFTRLFSSEDASEAALEVPDRDPYFDGDEAQRLLSVAISKLPPRQRAVFSLRYYDEMKYEDIAKILGSSVNSLKASYHFAYEKVREFIVKKINI